ncbi:phosphotransferase [Frigoribacterium sp. CFBP 8754]|uniref:maltokinase N-terminal cap-like domain-containing protein n=1 Tax=Frigoribacterium sp. CFBP 8754 TaxID=2775290 RepID=UPI001780E85E|nr:phosphotransferase [Frigoribacterium sp. CFBP 8754]MBD8659915.1 phosphotransferase [Frigoribacterium sp. CFBP 8754]
MSDVAPSLAGWMARQRWYATKGRTPAIRVIGSFEADLDGVLAITLLVIDEAPDVPVLYQVPVVARRSPLPGGDAAFIGSADDLYLYDAPHDPAYARHLFELLSSTSHVDGSDVAVDGTLHVAAGTVTRSRVLSGEQSNTSIIYDVTGGPVEHAIAKVFRVLHHGDNPDVTTQAALTEGGSTRVPTTFGSLHATWPDPGRDGGVASGHLAFSQEFLAGSEDAWRVALDAASAGRGFTTEAHDLGVAVAEVHATLARQLGTVEADQDAVDGALVSMRRRITTAAREVPEIAPHADAILRVYDAAGALTWPRLQRIHGDLHLGQALQSPTRGWTLLDFEGEPLRPMPERSRPDLALRDVAGMLRSFDYVAGSLAQQTPPVDVGTWAHDARAAFVDGYVASSGVDVRAQRALLDAFEIDKAVYEAIYESRNRPDWIGIPIAAVERLVARSAPATGN